MTAMNSLEKRQTIATALQAFATRPLQEAALTLLATLGYASDKHIDLTPATAEGFLTTFGQNKKHPWSGKSEAEAEKVFAKKYPAIYDHFKPMRQAMIKRCDQGKYFWELRACAYWLEFEQTKIIYPDIAQRCEFAFDQNQFYLDCTLFLIPEGSLYLVGILNSSIVRWFFPQICPTIRGGFMRFKSLYVGQIPIPTASINQKEAITKISHHLLMLNRAPVPNSSEISNYFEHLLNGLVYELFFPDELQAQKLTLFKHVENANLPVLDSIPENQRLAIVQETFERLNEPNQPVQECLYSLGSVESVRIIEGDGRTGE